jgi:hypothetical protein
MAEHMGGERVELVLLAQPSDVPPWTRVKGLLKAALRTWGFRCLSLRDLTPKLPPAALPPGPGGVDNAAGQPCRMVPDGAASGETP